MLTLFFDKGTLVLKDFPRDLDRSAGVKWDQRTRTHRAPAYLYRPIVLDLIERAIPYDDQARQFLPQNFPLQATIKPREHQVAAMTAWQDANRRAVVALPTGAGKTILAVLLIEQCQRPTLVHVPTIDLMHQWYTVLSKYFDTPIGLWGGGYNETELLTVSTYDSALLHVPGKGNRFGLIIFDECHHLPGEQYQFCAISNIAPFRLGLTATPERTDGREKLLYELCGDLCYEAEIRELKGETLAPYRVETIKLDLTEEERERYDIARKQYTDFLKQENISMGGARGWQNFLWKSSRTAEGRLAFKAYLAQKRLSLAASAKLEAVWKIISEHRNERILVFTQDNEMAYRIGREYYLPVLTHHTRLKEREAFLQRFRSGDYPVLVTSKVLNEGVDVPEASVGIIVSGSGSVREHVQRLGRILRAQPGKEAILYELVTKDTGEHYINQRRRRHNAYRK